jgi:hypothetical protein
VQAVSAAADLVARDEFDDRVVGVERFMTFDLKAEPARRLVVFERARSRARMPGR